MRLGGVSLDCAEPRVLASFWAALLGGEVAIETGDVAVVRLGDLLVTASRVEGYEPPTWPDGPTPKQLHLDLDVEDLDAAERRALSLGAVRASVQPNPESYLVLLDPAGHPFCLTTQIAAWNRSRAEAGSTSGERLQ